MCSTIGNSIVWRLFFSMCAFVSVYLDHFDLIWTRFGVCISIHCRNGFWFIFIVFHLHSLHVDYIWNWAGILLSVRRYIIMIIWRNISQPIDWKLFQNIFYSLDSYFESHLHTWTIRSESHLRFIFVNDCYFHTNVMEFKSIFCILWKYANIEAIPKAEGGISLKFADVQTNWH